MFPPLRRIFQQNTFQHTFKAEDLQPPPYEESNAPPPYEENHDPANQTPPRRQAQQRHQPSYSSYLDYRIYNPFDLDHYLFWNLLHRPTVVLVQQPQPQTQEQARQEPSFKWALVILVLLISLAAFSLLYSMNKLKKAIDNLRINRKKCVSVARLIAALTFGILGFKSAFGLGVYYAPVLFGTIVTPFLFGVLGFLALSGLGILFAKYLSKGLLRFKAWLDGTVPYTNTGIDSVSQEARDTARENTGRLVQVGNYDSEIRRAGLKRALFYKLKTTHPTEKALQAHYKAIKTGHDWRSPQVTKLLTFMYEATLSKVQQDMANEDTQSTSADELVILQATLPTVGEGKREIPEDLKAFCKLGAP